MRPSQQGRGGRIGGRRRDQLPCLQDGEERSSPADRADESPAGRAEETEAARLTGRMWE